eukprot:tig00021464_g21718.t1
MVEGGGFGLSVAQPGPSQSGSVLEPLDPESEAKLIPLLSNILERIIARNDKLAVHTKLTAFHAKFTPNIGVQAYLERIAKYASCSSACFIMALIYIDRIMQREKTFIITSLNVHRLIVTAVMVAAKFMDDLYYNNNYWSKIGGVSCAELNSLELDFLFMVDFELNVQPEVFREYVR